MALQISYQTEHGFTAPEAYVRVEQFRGDKSQVSVQLQYFYDAAARTDKQPIGSGYFQLEIADGATMAQMYAALKLLPEFAGALDV